MKKILFIITILCFVSQLEAQNLMGRVSEYAEDGQLKPVVGASVQWLGTNVGANSDGSGNFEIARNKNTNKLIVRYLAYENDTIEVKKEQTNLNIILSSANNLSAVEVVAAEGSYISIKPILTQVITAEGLKRAAC